MTGMFSQCTNLPSIPGTLFQYNVNLTQLSSMFRLTQFSTVPANLYASLMNLEILQENFIQSQLSSIPDSLFLTCTGLKTVYREFESTPVTALPDLLFDNNKNIISFYRAFFKCSLLAGQTPSGSDGIKLWDRAGTAGYPATVNGKGCFGMDYLLDEMIDGTVPYPWYDTSV
jgi:hypothetical protein